MEKSQAIIDVYKRYVMPTYAPTLALVKGKGTRVWDAEGRVYLDFIGGIAVQNVGHSNPAVVKAIQQQAEVLTHTSNLFYTQNQALLAKKLAELSLGGKCFFCNSGAEANEGLVKLARLWGHDAGRYEVITMKNSFHGRTLAMAAATGQAKIQKGFEPMPEGFRHADFNDLESVKAQITDKTVAVLVEAIQGEGGVVPADDGFLPALRQLCNERNLLLLCDEVQCGMGRTGHWFAYQGYGIVPDAFSLAKSLGNGFPIGAVVAGPKLADVFRPGSHASTFGGTPLACAAALAVIGVIEKEDLLHRAREAGARFRKGLESFAGNYEHVTGVRGRGLMLGLVLDEPAKVLTEKMAEAGLLGLATAENVVRFLPPLTVKDSEIDEALEILEGCLAEWHGVDLEPFEEEYAVEAGGEGEAAAPEEAAAEETVAELPGEATQDEPATEG